MMMIPLSNFVFYRLSMGNKKIFLLGPNDRWAKRIYFMLSGKRFLNPNVGFILNGWSCHHF
jgi:hypothetical protein